MTDIQTFELTLYDAQVYADNVDKYIYFGRCDMWPPQYAQKAKYLHDKQFHGNESQTEKCALFI